MSFFSHTREIMRTEVESPNPPLLDVRDIWKSLVSQGIFSTARRLAATDGVSTRLDRGDALAPVGEPGSCHLHPEDVRRPGR